MLLIYFLLDDWQLNRLKDSIWRLYLSWICVINCIEDSIDLSLKDNLPIVFLNLHIHVPKNISSFVRRTRNKLSATKKKNVFLINDFAIQNENEIECIGPQCSQNGITLNWLKNPHKLSVRHKRVNFRAKKNKIKTQFFILIIC